MSIVGISLYAEDVNALSDMVAGPPCALSLSLHARAVLGNLGLPELRRIAVGISDLRSDIYPIRCGVNYTYETKSSKFYRPTTNSAIFDEARLSAHFTIVWDAPGVSQEHVEDIAAQVSALPFLGGRVLHRRPMDCRILSDIDVPAFLQGNYVSR